jgi:hypothetical protein
VLVLQARVASLKAREIARVQAEERLRFEAELAQARAVFWEGGIVSFLVPLTAALSSLLAPLVAGSP